MFGPKIGTWMVHSKKDPRWNKSGRGYGLVTSGGPCVYCGTPGERVLAGHCPGR